MPIIKPEFYSKTPDEIQKLLDACVSKTLLARELKVSLKTLTKYIKLHNLKYISQAGKSPKPRPISKRETAKEVFRDPNVDVISKDLKTLSRKEALLNFYKMLAIKKEKRLLQELKDAYY